MADAIPDFFTPTIQYLNGQQTTSDANKAQLAAYAGILKNLQDRFGEYSALKPANYQNITAQQVGPSALNSIQNDPQSRLDQQAAIAELSNISKSGGLELSDRNALNQLEQTQSRNASARNQSLANQYAARGQLGSGAQLAMSLANNQNATQNANQQGESIAAQAQKRAMEAVLQKGQLSRTMSNDDYARKKSAADAGDSIARYNASMRTDAGKYNNSIAGQTYDDYLKKLAGETNLTTATNNALLGQGNQQAAGITAQGNLNNGLITATSSGIKGLASAIPKGGGGGGGGGGGSGDPNDPGLDASGQSDANGTRGGAADLSGGSTDTVDPNAPGLDPSELDTGGF
jgi:hypothetical protein